MPVLRALLLSTALISVAAAQPAVQPQSQPQSQSKRLPGGLTRQGDTVMMQPIPDGTSMAAGETPNGAHPSRIRVLSPADRDLFVRAFEAAGRADWVAARQLASQGQSPIARRLLEWRYALDKNSGATFAEIDAVIKDTDSKGGNWPLRGTLQARAESAMDPNMPPDQVIAWFASKNPNSSIGRIRLGEALVATGDKTRGAREISRGWAEGSFEPDIEQAILAKDAGLLSPESEKQRLDNLIWRSEIGAARRQLARVDAATRDIGNARIALYSSGWLNARAAVEKVRNSTDPNLLFDWSRSLRLADKNPEAHAILLKIDPASLVRAHAVAWWRETSIQTRDALAANDPKQALEIVRHAGFTAPGEQHTDQQFLAGFIALRFLKDPATALTHFQKLETTTTRPLSKSRAYYWEGRSLEAQGNTAEALRRYKLAAGYPETFYGQVALAHTDATPTIRLSDTPVEAVPAAEVDADALMPEAKILAELGQTGSLRLFIDRIVEAHSTPTHIKRVMMLLKDWGYPEIALRLAKGLSYGGTYLPDFTHPVITLPDYPGPGTAPEPALVLGLIRQETEFDPYAISGAGAQGLMQMMPASARLAAKQANLPYRPQALLTDVNYNMQLGMTEYRGHLDRYGGSLVLAAASYNAGAGNVKKWLATYGDPRQAVDPIDWIEQIPFGETRNYVQRVLENVQVYRARLAGKDTRLLVLNDLYAPGPPNMPVLTAAK